MTDRIKVVIDTNVLVSALWSSHGNPATVIMLIPKTIIPCVNPAILSEYIGVLNRDKFDFPSDARNRLLAKFIGHGIMIIPEKSEISFSDETDRVFYDTAKEAGAILITGNKRHFPDDPSIITPADFLTSSSNS